MWVCLFVCLFIYLFVVFIFIYVDFVGFVFAGYPQPEYRWMKDGSFQTEFSSEPVYKIQSIRREDAGVYQCVARNAVGSIFSDQVQILVACKFTIAPIFSYLSQLFKIFCFVQLLLQRHEPF